MDTETPIRLLGADDPPPVEEIAGPADSPILLVCEHAGQSIPKCLEDLGLPAAELQRHIAWDIGARALTRRLAKRLAAPAVLQRYSRLVIDCNRPVEVPTSIPEISDTTPIPANQHLDPRQRQARIAEVFRPFERAVAAGLDAGPRRLLADIHSFTPVMQGHRRPWEIGLLFHRDDRAATRLMRLLEERRPTLVAAFNEPYAVSDSSDYTIPVHGERRGLPHVLIEVRNDLIDHPEGVETWSALLADSLEALTKELTDA